MTYLNLNSPDVSAEHFDNEVLTVNIISGRYYSIKNTAAVFLRLVLDGNSKEDSIERIAELFSTDVNSISEDFNALIEELITENLIVESSIPKEILSSPWILSSNTEKYSRPSIEVHTDMEELTLLSP